MLIHIRIHLHMSHTQTHIYSHMHRNKPDIICLVHVNDLPKKSNADCVVWFLQALPYVCLLIAMLFFIYAIIGMQVR